jgi:serine/threonine protein kinase
MSMNSPEAPQPSPSESSNPEDVRRAIQTQHPGLGDDIQNAIKTLRKLQSIAGAPPGVNEESRDEAALATADGTAGGRQDDNGVPTLGAGETFGRYQISRLLGRGGMGAVYLAYDSQLCRYVALKTPQLGSNPDTVKRFYREARATATLRSPYICPVYDVGQIGGIHYLSMAFIDGKPLRQMIAEGQLTDLHVVAAIVAKVARGLQKAHEKGIIHRDIKSENIMIDSDGEPIVMDFGLAKQTNDDIHLTTPGRLIGSPAYMSPEQVDGDSDRIGPATDIYSLGVVLYEMLTARLPFWGSLIAILRAIPCDEPARPSSLVPAVGYDSLLERVCLKMIAKSPADRFPSMTAVAETLVPTTGSEEKAPPKRSWWQRLWSSSSPKNAASPDSPQQTVAGEVADDNGAFGVSAPHTKPPTAASQPQRPAAKPPAAAELHGKPLRDSGGPPPSSAADPDNLPTGDYAPPPKS